MTPARALLVRKERELRESSQKRVPVLAKTFPFVGLPGSRRYPRASLVIGDPARTVLRPDLRGAPGFHDPNAVELTRALKLIIAYAGIAAALAGDSRGESGADPRSLAPVAQLSAENPSGIFFTARAARIGF